MPHIIVKLYPGPSEKQKNELAQRIVKDVTATLGHAEDTVSVDIEEVAPTDWPTNVYRADISAHWNRLYKKPGYRM